MMILDTHHFGSGHSFPDEQRLYSRIQPLIAYGYKMCSRHCYFLRIQTLAAGEDPVSALMERGVVQPRRYLLEDIHAATVELQASKIASMKVSFDMGFSYQGLEKLNVKTDLLEVFRRKSPVFYDNAFVRAHRHLGDTGLSSPEGWDEAFQTNGNHSSFDIVLIAHIPILYFEGSLRDNLQVVSEIESRLTQKLTGFQANFFNTPCVERAMPLDETGTEHFGYRDGITSPVYSSKAPKRDDEGYRKSHALGEIMLGHPRNNGDNLYASLDLTKKAHTELNLQPVPSSEKYKGFFNDSSFCVIRKMEQRVDVFNQWVDETAKRLLPQDAAMGVATNSSDPYELAKRWVKAKIMGRSVEGLLLTSSLKYGDLTSNNASEAMKANKKAKTDLNDFRFHHRDASFKPASGDDSLGLACPFASHIRRMNPRDDPVTPTIHRPVLRRGMPYSQIRNNVKTVGMLGLFFCADIVQQFEHLVGAWGQNRVMGIPDRSQTRDPIIGQHEPQANCLYLGIPQQHAQHRAAEFAEPFVITRGCAYAWFPSRATLKNLVDADELICNRV
jgi:deferrochelatase/peroxidase EfeB